MPEVVVDLDNLKYLEQVERNAQHLADGVDALKAGDDQTATLFKGALESLITSLIQE